jgi:hypothetical protein
VKGILVAWSLLKYCGDVRGEIFSETPKYEGKTGRTQFRAGRETQEERYFGDLSVALAGVILILALRNRRNSVHILLTPAILAPGQRA